MRKGGFMKNGVLEVLDASKITIPQNLLLELGLNDGDEFELVVKDGGIFMMPVAIYEPEELAYLQKIATEHEAEESKSFGTVLEMFEHMGVEI